MEYDYIFWDNDGILVDTEGLYFQASHEALQRLGISLSHDDFARISLQEGRSVFALATADGHSPEAVHALRCWRDQRYAELLGRGDLVLPGVFETLAALHRKVGMAIVTSSRQTHFATIHRHSNLLQFIDFVLTREDYAETKPDPEPYLLALANSRTGRHRCLVIEDSPRGVTAAKAAGLCCWVIPSSQTKDHDFGAADRVLETIRDVPELLLR